MKYKFLLTSFFLLSLNPLCAQASCPTSNNSQSINYIRRDNNRCEGIKSRGDSARGLNLISLAIRGISTYSNPLTLQIPRISNTTPQVRVESLRENYLLDSLALISSQSSFTFGWNSYVLSKAQIPASSLRALASINLDSQLVFIPVTIGKPSANYEFVFYTSQPAKFSTIEIISNSKVIYRKPSNNFQTGEVIFTWDGRNAPAGRYQLHIEAEQEQIGSSPEKVSRSFAFEHNPRWLK